MTPEKPTEWGHPQFDPANHRQFQEFMEREGLPEVGLVFKPAPNIEFSSSPRSFAAR